MPTLITQDYYSEEVVKIQPKGLLTIPIRFREDLFRDNPLARIKKEKGRLVIEPVRTLPYPVRGYSRKDIQEFLAFDKLQTKELKRKKLL